MFLLSFFRVVTLLYKYLKVFLEMRRNYFVAGFLSLMFVLLIILFAVFFVLVKAGASQETLTIIWGGIIFLFVFLGVVAVSLVFRYIGKKKVQEKVYK